MATTCAHLDQLHDVTPSSPDSCAECRAMGDTWFHLRICLVCGQVACCDGSKNKHASAHYRATGHPLIQSFERREAWRWCYADDCALPDGKPFR